MATKYPKDDLEVIYSSSRENIGTQHSLGREDPQINQSSYFISDHTHYCLNCRDWYTTKKSIFECKLQHTTVTHTEHIIYCV